MVEETEDESQQPKGEEGAVADENETGADGVRKMSTAENRKSLLKKATDEVYQFFVSILRNF